MTPPFWNSLETTKSISLWSQGLAIFFAVPVCLEAVAHWHKRKETANRFGTFAILAYAVAVVLESVGFLKAVGTLFNPNQ
jgi:hypothetical protein